MTDPKPLAEFHGDGITARLENKVGGLDREVSSIGAGLNEATRHIADLENRINALYSISKLQTQIIGKLSELTSILTDRLSCLEDAR